MTTDREWEQIDARVDQLPPRFPPTTEEQAARVRAIMQPSGLAHLPENRKGRSV